MSEPHTHGGTDAPECTTCRPTQREALSALIAAHDTDYMECPDHIGRCDPAGCHNVGPKAEHQADVIFASDWLAEPVIARIRKQALDEVLRAIDEDMGHHEGAEVPWRDGYLAAMDRAECIVAKVRDGGEQ